MTGVATIVIERRPGEIRAAALDVSGEVLEFRVERDCEPLIVGAVYAGRVRAVRAEIGAAFVDIGEDKDGFLNLRKDRVIGEGDLIAVRVTRDAEGGKGAKLSMHIPDGVPEPVAPGLILAAPRLPERLLGEWADAETARIVVDDAELHRALSALDGRVEMGDGAAFRVMDLDDAFAHALEPQETLPSGGHILIERTAAMTTIDVNAGTAMSGSVERQALETNLEAATVIQRELRRRNIGGLIAVDFLRMSSADNQKQVMNALTAGLDNDPRKPKAAGFSTFGLVEIVRRKDGPSLAEMYLTRGAEMTPASRAIDLLAVVQRRRGTSVTVRVSPAVGLTLTGPLAAARKDVEARLGFDIEIVEVSHGLPGGYEIEEG